jgi:soluble lytic murein transglycosylase-like protein
MEVRLRHSRVAFADPFEALIQQESGGRPGAVGPQTKYGRALGMTQMLPETAKEMAAKLGMPFRPDLLRGTSKQAAAYQRRLGKAYFEEGLAKTGNLRDALHYYHGGPDRSLWGPKTRAYAQAVLGRMGGR